MEMFHWNRHQLEMARSPLTCILIGCRSGTLDCVFGHLNEVRIAAFNIGKGCLLDHSSENIRLKEGRLGGKRGRIGSSWVRLGERK